ncbi:ankyrin repeat domain-containing protein, partial [bacterium]|nr:ankyrin repeat domain-containing protein [bacterium]
IYAYFGKTQVHRKLNRKHIVFKVKTGFEPTVEYGRNGKIDWNKLDENGDTPLHLACQKNDPNLE